jgi:hypothetical protein
MQRPAIAGERVKTEHIPGWIDVRGKTKPRHRSIRSLLCIEFLTEHMGEYVGREEIARYCGSAGQNIDSLLADVEQQDTPFVIWQDEDRPHKSIMAVPKEWM